MIYLRPKILCLLPETYLLELVVKFSIEDHGDNNDRGGITYLPENKCS